jgi:hypothetical protein
MKNSLKIFFALLALSGFSFAFADKSPSNFVRAKEPEKTIKVQDFIFEDNSSDKTLPKAEKPVQKSETKAEKLQTKAEIKNDADKEDLAQKAEIKAEKDKIAKNLNNLLIESYKVKFSKILGNLSYNIKNKSKEEKIKILSTVLITTKEKIDQIDSNKMQLSDNRKEVLEGILKHLKSELEQEIKDVAKEK